MKIRRLFLVAALLAACTAALAASRGPTSTQASVVYGGVTRTYYYHLPNNAAPSAAVPVLFVFHGNGGSAHGMEGNVTLLDSRADAHKFIVVYVQGANNTWTLTSRTADPGLVPVILAALKAKFPISNVYLAGYSLGAGMARQTAACNPGLASGLFTTAEDVSANSWLVCGTPKPLTEISFHGTADPVSPWDGGQTGVNYAAINGCTDNPAQVSTTQNGAEVYWSRSWTACTKPVTFYAVDGMGHYWPGGGQTTTSGMGTMSAMPVMSDIIAAAIH